jgi:MTH538 TIR-like domain (DUF1863)
VAYRNKTYIIFDGENDIWAYRYMRGWDVSKHIDFNFHDAHDLNTIRDWSMPDTVRRRLRERFSSGKQAIVLIGENTRHKHRFVRWEMEVALDLGLPIVAVNLNKKRRLDPNLCPPILRGEYVMHVAFRARIIKYALDNFPYFHARQSQYPGSDWYYPDDVYCEVGIDI